MDARIKAQRSILASDKESDFPPRVAGKGEPFAPNKRQIPSEHDFNPKAIKPMARTLWAASIALGHVLTAYRQFSRIKSSTVSPDGLLGGRGYVMGIKDVRDKLKTASDALADITDTLYDEINGPHWKPKLAQLTRNEREDVDRFVDEAKHSMEDGDEDAAEEMEAIEAENDGPKGKNKGKKKSWVPDKLKGKGDLDGSSMPDAGNVPVEEGPRDMTRMASSPNPWKVASSLPVETIPGGPRVDTLDRTEPQGPYGSFNEQEVPSQPEWTQTDGKVEGEEPPPVPTPTFYHDVPLEAAEGHLAIEAVVLEASSAQPTDTTPSEGLDFGLGYGADGKGLERGPVNPSAQGVYGPHSGLPGNAPVPSSGATDSTVLDSYLSDRRELAACVAKRLRGETQIAAYLDEAVVFPVRKASSQVPDGESSTLTRDPSTPGVGEVTEDGATPYARLNYITPEYQPEEVFGRPQDKKEPTNV